MRFYAFFVLLLCSIPSISQNCDNQLRGRVLDLHDETPLAGATLIISETGKAVQTNLEGEYSFNGLCDAIYSIQVSHPLCLTRGFQIKISGNTERDFRLEHHLEELNQVILEGKAFQNKTESIDEIRISNEELDRYSSGSLGDALNSISGVSSLNTGNTVVKPLINGLHSSRVVIINNGVRMEDQEWGAEHAPNIDINAVGSISLVKGAGALKYSGDAVGGVIITESQKVPLKDTLYGQTRLTAASNGRGTAVTSELTRAYQNGWYTGLQGTVKRFGDYEAPDYILSNTGNFERNFSFRFGLNNVDSGFEAYYSLFKNEIGILRASHLGGAQDQVNAINSDRPLIVRDFTYSIDAPKQDVTHHLARIEGFKKFQGLGKLKLRYDFQRNNRLEFDIRRGDDADKASLDLELDTHSLAIDLESELYPDLNLDAGILGSYQNNFADPNTGVRRLIPDYEKYSLGFYTTASYQLFPDFLVEAGGRYDYTYMDVFKFYRKSFWESKNYDEIYPEIVIEETNNQVLTNPQPEFHNLSATAGFRYEFRGDYSLFFNYSLASRAPNPSELYSEGLHHSASRIELGNLGFKSEVSHKIGATLKRQTSGGFNFSVYPYVNTINDFIIIEPTGVQQTIRGNFQVWEYRQTNAQLLGVDLDANFQVMRNLSFNHQFSLVKGYDRTKDEPLINIPAANTTNGLVYQDADLKNLRLGLQSEYVFAQNEYPDNNFEVFIPETGTSEIVDVSTPPGAYHLLHLNSSIELPLNNSKLSVGFSINNLLDTSYRNYLNRLRYYADDLGRNFLLNLKLNY
ncbi:TonB-dependent receptor [Christiangramia sp.]|uniref:TonB-dependent receptor n=1 Tax=Christiangramia sp. TaxID=1931228 RepID=UPI00260BD225|nr:TonB-dependent receptor [Christiangramia sp.]